MTLVPMTDNMDVPDLATSYNKLTDAANGTPFTLALNNAAPTDVDLTILEGGDAVLKVTTDGSGLPQTVNVPFFTFTYPVGNEFINPSMEGRRLTIFVDTFADPADSVLVTVDGGTMYIKDGIGNTIAASASGALLDYEGSSLSFVWSSYEWYADNSAENTGTIFETQIEYLPSTSGLTPSIQYVLHTVGSSGAGWRQTAGLFGTVQSLFPSPSGETPYINFGYYVALFTSGAGADIAELENAGASYIGMSQVLELININTPGDTVLVTGPAAADIMDTDGVTPLTSVTFDTLNQWAQFELIAINTWRYVRGTAVVVHTPVVADLPAAGVVGRRSMVSDALTPVFGAAVTGGGAVSVPVYDDGTIWRVG